MEHTGPQSGLIIEVPEAEPAVARHRERLDASALLGVPAHITVLFPFMPPQAIDSRISAQLEQLFATVSRFSFQLDRTEWFDEDVLWLAPRDSAPFRALTSRVHVSFPAYPPYGGQFEDVIPHLTVGYGHPEADLHAAERSVQPHLPVNAKAVAVSLMIQQSPGGHWTRAATFALGP